MTTSNADSTELSDLIGSWVLDLTRSTIVIHTKAMWLLNVTGTAKLLSGEGIVTSDGAVSGSLVVDAASIDTKNAKRDTHLRTADFFEVEKYPTIVYTASGATAVAGGVQITGTLTMRGQTNPVDFLAQLSVSGESLTLTSEVAIDRSSWGVTWNKMGAGLANRVQVNAHFDRI